MKKKQLRKILRRLEVLEAKLDRLAAREKRVIDRAVGLATEHVGRLLREEGPSERSLVDAIARALREDLRDASRRDRRRDRLRERLDVEALAAELARRLRAVGGEES